MITIDQLLESVDLDFEPRFVTKDKDGTVEVWSNKPYRRNTDWDCELITGCFAEYDHLKLSEFAGKDWQECIYEVPRKTTGKIERLEPLNGLQHNWLDKINELVDAVNELKGSK